MKAKEKCRKCGTRPNNKKELYCQNCGTSYERTWSTMRTRIKIKTCLAWVWLIAFLLYLAYAFQTTALRLP
jgi:uncharacterized membrane protein YvbJ